MVEGVVGLGRQCVGCVRLEQHQHQKKMGSEVEVTTKKRVSLEDFPGDIKP